MTSYYIYKLVLVFLHAIYSGLEFLHDIWIYVKINFIENNRDQRLEERYLVKIKQFEKIPQHITVILGTEKPCMRDLANLVLWCLNAGISFISFYDHEGFIQKHEHDLRNEVESLKEEKDHVIWKIHESDLLNNRKSNKCIRVKTLSLVDGRQSIVDTTKELASNYSSKDINIEFLDSQLRKHFEFPDPSLGLYCGKHFNVYGYPPWYIRVTEFVNVRTFHNISQQCFFEILKIYSKVEQKLGK